MSSSQSADDYDEELGLTSDNSAAEDNAPLLTVTKPQNRSPSPVEDATDGSNEDKNKPDASSLSKLELKRLLAVAKPEALRISLALISLILASASFLVVPSIMGAVIDSVMNPGKSQFTLGQSVVTLFIIFLLSSIFTFLRSALFTIAGERIVADLRKNVFLAIVRQEIGFFDTNRTGELINRLSSDCTVLQSTVTVNLSMGLRWGLQAVGGFFVLFYISWRLTLVMLAIFPLIAAASWVYGKYVRARSKEVQERLAEANTVAEETLSSMRTVRAFSAELKEQLRYASKVEESFVAAKRRAYAEGIFAAAATLIANVAIAGVLWYGGSLVLSGDLSVGTLTSFILYTLTVAMAFGGLSALYGDLMKAVGASERVFQLMDRQPQVPYEAGLVVSRDRIKGNVKFENVTFAYPSRHDQQIINNLSLEFKSGKVLALVGPSGGGKSTIAHLIEGFYLPSSGRILLDDQDLSMFNGKEIRRQMAIVSQEPTLFACTIADNIAYGTDPSDFANEEERMNRIVRCAKMSNAHDFIIQFPQGYLTLVGERGVRLSGGQKQRIAIARALLMDPKILLLDEATSALDAESEYLVKRALDELLSHATNKRTVLVIAHRLSTVKNADEVAVIVKGQVVEQGTHDELVSRDGVYKKLVARQLLAQD